MIRPSIPTQSTARKTPRVPYTASTANRFGRRRTAWQQAERETITLRSIAGWVPDDCTCCLYVDVLTAGRWRWHGYLIRKGESAIHRAGHHANTPLFCRCQIAPISAPINTISDGDDIPGFEAQ